MWKALMPGAAASEDEVRELGVICLAAARGDRLQRAVDRVRACEQLERRALGHCDIADDANRRGGLADGGSSGCLPVVAGGNTDWGIEDR